MTSFRNTGTCVALVLLVSGCGWADGILDKQVKPGYCASHPQFPNCPKDAGPTGCSSNTDCTQLGATVCDIHDSMSCVQCLPPDQTSACTGATPVCTGTTCQKCTRHSECTASNVCLPDGSCADALQVAYVQPGGSGAACTLSMPCSTLDAALKTTRPLVKLTGLTKDTKTTTINNQTVTILADTGAILDRDLDGPILEIKSNSDVQIYDLQISGASGAAGADGIDLTAAGGTPKLQLVRTIVTGNAGLGISANGGTLTVAQSTISLNPGGGLLVTSASFDITNSYIFRNGEKSTSTFGGLNLQFASVGSNRLAFNTIVDNDSSTNSGGVVCSLATFTAPNNIIAHNAVAGSTTGAQTSGPCVYPTSKIQDDVAGLAFEHPDVPAPFSYRLLAGSTAIDQALTPVPVDVDNEGDVRPQGPQKDIGADEYRVGQ